VKDRILYFNEKYPNGQIKTDLISHEDELWIVKATVWPNAKEERCFSDYSQARESQGMVNKTAALENASTSAIGRCLALMGIGVLDSIASADEIVKSERAQRPAPGQPATVQPALSQPDSSELPVVLVCETCGEEAAEKEGVSKSGRPFHGIFCSSGEKSHAKWL